MLPVIIIGVVTLLLISFMFCGIYLYKTNDKKSVVVNGMQWTMIGLLAGILTTMMIGAILMKNTRPFRFLVVDLPMYAMLLSLPVLFMTKTRSLVKLNLITAYVVAIVFFYAVGYGYFYSGFHDMVLCLLKKEDNCLDTLFAVFAMFLILFCVIGAAASAVVSADPSPLGIECPVAIVIPAIAQLLVMLFAYDVPQDIAFKYIVIDIFLRTGLYLILHFSGLIDKFVSAIDIHSLLYSEVPSVCPNKKTSLPQGSNQ